MKAAVSPVGRKPAWESPFQPPNSVYCRPKSLFCAKKISSACGAICGISASMITTRSANVISCGCTIPSSHPSSGAVTSSILPYSHS